MVLQMYVYNFFVTYLLPEKRTKKCASFYVFVRFISPSGNCDNIIRIKYRRKYATKGLN